MTDNFFGFSAQLPRTNVLGHQSLGEELLTDSVEEEFDALNDETFGSANNDDWEEAHEKLAELIHKNNLGGDSFFNDGHLDNDESQNEIVSKSISQLGLEDDLDDPAIMTMSHSSNSSMRLRSAFNASPPPPAILETEVCGSPKTYSIWSTTPKDSGISSFLQSISQKSGSLSQETSTSFKSGGDDVFVTPPKAWRAEELERDLLSIHSRSAISSDNWSPMGRTINSNVPSVSQVHTAEQNLIKEVLNKSHRHEDLERAIFAESTKPTVQSIPSGIIPVMRPVPQQSVIPSVGPHRVGVNGMNHSPVLPFQPMRGPMLGSNIPPGVDPHFIARMNAMRYPPLIRPGMPNLPPGFNAPNMNLNHAKLLALPPRAITHPLLHKQFQFPMVFHNKMYEEEHLHNGQICEDEYAGLMTQREREWLIRIQLLQLKSENPYVEDYYYTTQVARQCQKKYSENASSNTGKAPELILPETSKHENRTFVPTQFEGSLGKLQAVSVNFPRKILDITVARCIEDEETKAATNQSLMKYRRLLLDIEKLFSYFLSIEDEERKILAKPDSVMWSGAHEENVVRLKKQLFCGFSCDNSSDENFLNIMSVRKGRRLLMRVFKIFNSEQQVCCLSLLLRYLPVVLKKDQNDQVLIQNVNMITDAILTLSIHDLIVLSKALCEDSTVMPRFKECSTLSSTFKNKFSSSVICSIIVQAENLFDTNSIPSDLKTNWTDIIVQITNCLCSLPVSSVCEPYILNPSISKHFKRFSITKDNLDQLNERLKILTLGWNA